MMGQVQGMMLDGYGNLVTTGGGADAFAGALSIASILAIPLAIGVGLAALRVWVKSRHNSR